MSPLVGAVHALGLVTSRPVKFNICVDEPVSYTTGGGRSNPLKRHIPLSVASQTSVVVGTLQGLYEGDVVVVRRLVLPDACTVLPVDEVGLDVDVRLLVDYCTAELLKALSKAHLVSITRPWNVGKAERALKDHACHGQCTRLVAVCQRPLVSAVNPFGLQDYAYLRHRVNHTAEGGDSSLQSNSVSRSALPSGPGPSPAFEADGPSVLPSHLGLQIGDNVVRSAWTERPEHVFPPMPNTKEAVRQFVCDWTDAISEAELVERPCGVCAQLKAAKGYHRVGLDDPCMRVLYVRASHVAVPDNCDSVEDWERVLCREAVDRGSRTVEVCSTCHGAVKKRKRLPVVSLANGLCMGDVPPELQDLNFMERTMIALYRHNICVLNVNSTRNEQRRMKANAVIFSQPIQKVRAVLPPPPEELDDCVLVLFTGPCKPTEQDLKRTPFLFRRRHFLRALNWLREHNRYYRDVQLSHSNLDQYADNAIPVNWMYQETDGSPLKDTLPVHDVLEDGTAADGACPVSVVGVCPDDVDALNLDRDTRVALAVKHLNQGGHMLSYGHGSEPESIYKNPRLFPGLFPWLFPYGFGSFNNDRVSVAIPWKKHVKFFMNYHDRRFQRDEYFPFIVFNQRQIKESSRGSYVLTERRNFTSVVDKILGLDLEALDALIERGKDTGYVKPVTDAEKRCFELIHIIDNVGGYVPASRTQKKFQRNEAKSMIYELGAPAVFVTFAPNDIGNLICLKYCGQDINLDDVFPHIPSKDDRARAIAENPVAGAKFFNLMVELFVKHILRAGSDTPGLFGHTSGYYGTVESQGRQTLHLHLLVWITNALTPQEVRDRIVEASEDFRLAIFSWLESCQQGEFATGTLNSWNEFINAKRDAPGGYDDPTLKLPTHPDKTPFADDLDAWYDHLCNTSDELVALCNYHSPAHKYNCRRPPDFQCRARFPRDYVPFTQADTEVGDIILKKRERWVNTFNRVFTYLSRCNTDITPLRSGNAIKAVIAYVTNYITKMNVKTYTIFSIMKAVFERNAELMSGSISRAEAARKLISKMVNGLTARLETGAPMACTDLLGLPLHYTSHCFKPFFWYSYQRVVDSDWGNGEGDNDVVSELATVSVGKTAAGVGLVSKVHDYIYRPYELETMSLSAFLKHTVIRKLTPRMREKQPAPRGGLDRELDVDEDEERIVDDYDAEDDDEDDEDEPERVGIRPSVRLDTSRYYHFHPDHPKYGTHAVFKLKSGYSYFLNYAGRSLPRKDQEDREEYCKVMLMLFSPGGWRTGKDLKSDTQSWEDAFRLTSFSPDDVRRMDYMHVMFECYSARDEHAKQRAALAAELGITQDVGPIASADADEVDGDVDDDFVVGAATEGDVERLVESTYDYFGEYVVEQRRLMETMEDELQQQYLEGEYLHPSQIEPAPLPANIPQKPSAEWKVLLHTARRDRIDERYADADDPMSTLR